MKSVTHPFTTLQKFGIVTFATLLFVSMWYFFQIRADTTVGVTLVTNAMLENGLEGHWTFDGKDMSTSTAFDRSGNDNHAYGSTSSAVVAYGAGASSNTSPGSYSFEVPVGVTSITVKTWGAGGGSGGGGRSTGLSGAGGGGGFAQSIVSVTPGETLTVYVGGGGGGGSDLGDYGAGGGGGGWSGIKRSGTSLVIGGGGAGGGGVSWDSTGDGGAGGGGGGSSGQNGTDGEGTPGGHGGGGGTQSAVGSGGSGGNTSANGVSGSGQTGGKGGDEGTGDGSAGTNGGGGGGGGSSAGEMAGGGGGGGGYYGGGGGEAGDYTGVEGGGGGGGGGSGYGTTTTQASGATSANTGDADYAGSAGQGGSGVTNAAGNTGNNGRVVLSYSESTMPGTTQGPIGQALEFDGASEYVDMGDGISLANQSFSFSLWVKRSKLGWGCMLSAGSSGSDNNMLHICFRDTNVLTMGFWNNDLDTSQTYTSTTEWLHIAGTYNASTNARRLYVNGALVANDTASADMQGDGNFEIGRIAGEGYYFSGAIDDVRVYTSVLTDSNIQRLYTLGATTRVATTLITNPALENGLEGHWTFDGKDMSTSTAFDLSGNDNHAYGSTSASSLAVAYGAGASSNTSSGSYSFEVPAGVTSITVKTWGAGGGSGGTGGTGLSGAGGGGGFAQSTISVTPGETLTVYVGGGGGGGGASVEDGAGGGGGGWSGIKRSGTPLVIGGGGAGGGGASYDNMGDGGAGGGGGGSSGQNGTDGEGPDGAGGGGGGGTQSAVGAGGNANGDDFPNGANGSGQTGGKGGDGGTGDGLAGVNGGGSGGGTDLELSGGGGGGGYYGGGGGSGGGFNGDDNGAGGGGGGSGYGTTTTQATSRTAANSGDTNYAGNAGRGGVGVSGVDGETGNDGRVVLSYTGSESTMPGTTQGPIGQALEFDGVDDRVTISHDTALNQTTLSVSSWVYVESPPQDYQGIVLKTTTQNWDDGYGLYLYDDDLPLKFYVDDYWIPTVASTTLPVKEWVHAVGTYDGATIKLYKNGELVDSVPFAGPITHSTSDLLLGNAAGNLPNGYPFSGRIDDARIYSRALSAEEVRRLYTLGATTRVATTLTTNPALENGLAGHWTFDGAQTSGFTVSDRSPNAHTGTIGAGTSTRTFGAGSASDSSPGTYTFQVPSGVTSMTVKSWGGGGGGGSAGSNASSDGGGGGGGSYTRSTLSVTPGETLTVYVGGGGGGGVANVTGNSGGGGGGGGRSGISRGSTDLLISAGGGGGGGGDNSSATLGGVGGGGGNTTSGSTGGPSSAAAGGGGGTSSSGGSGGAGDNAGSNGASLTGGAGADGRDVPGDDGSGASGGSNGGGSGGVDDVVVGFAGGGGGGAGYYGGGGGGGSITSNAGGGGGGGGSSLTTGSGTTATVGNSGSGVTGGNAGNNSDGDYSSSAGAGGNGGVTVDVAGSAGTAGRVVIAYAGNIERTPGPIGQALEFDGVDDYVALPAFDETLTSATFVAWIKARSFADYDGIILSRGTNVSGMNISTADTLGYHWNNVEETWGWTGSPAVPRNEWVFVAVVVEPSKATAYVGSTEQGLVSAVNAVSHTSSRLDALEIGRDSDSSSRYFDGSIDDARIYSRALSVEEVKRLYDFGR